MADKVVINCTTGARSVVALSPAEESALAALRQATADMESARQRVAEQRQADLEAVKSYASARRAAEPVWGAVARLLGAL